MKDNTGSKAKEKRRPGRPKIYDTPADRVASFRENNSGHRYDVYLDKEAHQILRHIMKQTGLSASKALSCVLMKQIKLPQEGG